MSHVISHEDVKNTAFVLGLNQTAVIILKEFLSLHNAGKQIFLSLKELATRAVCHITTVKRALRVLVRYGLIKNIGWGGRTGQARKRELIAESFAIEEIIAVPAADENAELILMGEDGELINEEIDNDMLWADEIQPIEEKRLSSLKQGLGSLSQRLGAQCSTKLSEVKELLNNKVSKVSLLENSSYFGSKIESRVYKNE